MNSSTLLSLLKSRTYSTIALLAGVVAALTALPALLILTSSSSQLSGCNVPVQAEILRRSASSFERGGHGRYSTLSYKNYLAVVDYQYHIGSKIYRGEDSSGPFLTESAALSAYQPGASFTVYYNPNSPEQSAMNRPNSAIPWLCAVAATFALIAVLMIIFQACVAGFSGKVVAWKCQCGSVMYAGRGETDLSCLSCGSKQDKWLRI